MIRKRGKSVLRHLVLAFLATVWLIPIVWLVCNSFSSYQGMNVINFFPKEWTLNNYKLLLMDADTVAQFPKWFMNTFIIAICVCIISSSFVLMVSYAMSCMRFPMRKPLMNIAIILNLFPGFLSLIAVYFILKSFNLTNSHLGLILVYSASSGLGYLVAKGFFDTVPVSLREAAYLEGANEAKVFLKIVLNSGISSDWTVAIGLYNMLDRTLIHTYFSRFCAGGVLVSIPISILFVIMQKFYVEGITGGSVKG